MNVVQVNAQKCCIGDCQEKGSMGFDNKKYCNSHIHDAIRCQSLVKTKGYRQCSRTGSYEVYDPQGGRRLCCVLHLKQDFNKFWWETPRTDVIEDPKPTCSGVTNRGNKCYKSCTYMTMDEQKGYCHHKHQETENVTIIVNLFEKFRFFSLNIVYNFNKDFDCDFLWKSGDFPWSANPDF